jgi:hypothetical protein
MAGEDQRTSVRAALPSAVVATFDVVFLAVKSQHTQGALDAIEPHLLPRSVVVSLQNGVNEPHIARRIGPERTIGCLVDFSSGPVPLYLRMMPEAPKDVYFIGLFQPLGCIWPAAELQSKILARYLSGQWSPPGDLRTLIRDELEHPDVDEVRDGLKRLLADVDHHVRREHDLAYDEVELEIGGSE